MNQTASSKVFPLLSFLIPLSIRAVPEILMGPFITGYDPLGYYIPYTLTWLREGINLWSFLGASPFLYMVLLGSTSVGIPVVLMLKTISPLLLGCLGIVVYAYANRTLLWSPKKSMFAASFATLYFVALRISWDMLRSELALVFLFVVLIFVERDNSKPLNAVLLSVAMISVVLAHQLIGAILIAIVGVTLLRLHLRKERYMLRRLVVCSVPMLLLFTLMVYADVRSPQYPMISVFSQDSELLSTGWGFTSHADLLLNSIGFFVFCYLPLIPLFFFVRKSFNSILSMKVWVIFLFILICAVLATASVFFGVLPYRLVLLFTYPLSLFAVDAFSRIRKLGIRIFTGLILATLTVCFVVLPYDFSFPYYNLFPTYVPRSILMNTVPLSDCQDTENALRWVSDNLAPNSRLLTHNAFYGWALLTVPNEQIVPYGFNNLEKVLEEQLKNNYQYYVIWWINNDRWFGQPPLPSGFKQVYRSGRIAIFNFTRPENNASMDY